MLADRAGCFFKEPARLNNLKNESASLRDILHQNKTKHRSKEVRSQQRS